MSPSAPSPVQVFPDGRVPANLLRWHLFFDEPVDAFALDGAITLLDSFGAAVPHAFVDMPGGLWDASGTRLTLLLHPGRIKSGLQAHAQLGGALACGQQMSLRIDLERLLGPGTGTVEHGFAVGEDERRRIDIQDWRLGAVAAGTRDALVIAFDRPMDRLSLEGAVAVLDASGNALSGSFSITSDGAALTFTPRQAWSPELHRLTVQEDLEDVAGNRVRTPFESTAQQAPAAKLERTFRVSPANDRPAEFARG